MYWQMNILINCQRITLLATRTSMLMQLVRIGNQAHTALTPRTGTKMIAANATAYLISDAMPEGKIALFCVIIIIMAVIAFKLKSR
jgi:hypothetical protein